METLLRDLSRKIVMARPRHARSTHVGDMDCGGGGGEEGRRRRRWRSRWSGGGGVGVGDDSDHKRSSGGRGTVGMLPHPRVFGRCLRRTRRRRVTTTQILIRSQRSGTWGGRARDPSRRSVVHTLSSHCCWFSPPPPAVTASTTNFSVFIPHSWHLLGFGHSKLALSSISGPLNL
jgi:hypothetical protein